MGTEFRLLCSVTAVTNDRVIDIGSARQQCVLVALLVDVNHVVPADQLVERVWGVGAPSGAKGALYSYLSRLRLALGDTGVRIDRSCGGYLITADPTTIDLHLFRALVAEARYERALRLWRGEAFGALDSPWINDLRGCLGAERRAAELDHVDLVLRRGGHADLLPALSARVLEHPLDERLAGQLMRALFLSGKQAEALAAYHRIRADLVEQLGTEPAPELRGLHERLLRGDLQVEDSPTVPRQLPAEVPVFVGRQADLAALDQHAGVVVISAIQGAAGVGKTALAVTWAYRVAERFPGGQLYANLRGFDPDLPPADPKEVLGRFLRALGVDPAQIPDDLDERAALFRTTAQPQRMLVVLDNVASVDQVRPLLPGGHLGVVVVTSRNQLAGLVAVDGARLVRLDVLVPAESLALLESLLGAGRVAEEPDAAAELAELCGGLPLALRVAAGKLVVNPGVKIADAVTEMRAGSRLAALEIEDDRRASVSAALGLSYRALAPGERELFRGLGLVPGGEVTVAAAAVLVDTDYESAARLLDRLVAVHLVEPHRPGRYRLHDLVWRYARERSAEDEAPDMAVTRLFEWYTATADAAAQLLYPSSQLLPPPDDATESFVDTGEAWTWLEDERACLVAAIDHAADSGRYETAWRLADAVRGFFLSRTYFDDWQRTADAGLRAARQDGGHRAQAAMHLNAGTTRWAVSDYQGFAEHSAAAVEFAEQASWRYGEAKALGNLGFAYLGVCDPVRAVRYTEESLAVWRAVDSVPDVIRCLIILGHTYTETGRLTKSHSCFAEAWSRSEQLTDRLETSRGLGWVHLLTGHPQDAEKCFREGLACAREQGDDDAVAYSLAGLAQAALDLGRPARARELAREGLAGGGVRERTEIELLNVAGRVDGKVGHHRQALDRARRVHERYDEIDALIGLSRAHLGIGEHDRALAFGTEALGCAQEAGFRVLEGQALTALAEAALANGDAEHGHELARRALQVHQETGHRPGEQRTQAVLQGFV